MNTDINMTPYPAHTPPTPPEGMRWEYRGMGWTNGRKLTTFYTLNSEGETGWNPDTTPLGFSDTHYFEAVPGSEYAEFDAAWRDKVDSGSLIVSESEKDPDPVNHPPHYKNHPSGVECITITEHMGFNLGNATKYIWRADLKNDAIEDLKKAAWYIDREIKRREGA